MFTRSSWVTACTREMASTDCSTMLAPFMARSRASEALPDAALALRATSSTAAFISSMAVAVSVMRSRCRRVPWSTSTIWEARDSAEKAIFSDTEKALRATESSLSRVVRASLASAWAWAWMRACSWEAACRVWVRSSARATRPSAAAASEAKASRTACTSASPPWPRSPPLRAASARRRSGPPTTRSRIALRATAKRTRMPAVAAAHHRRVPPSAMLDAATTPASRTAATMAAAIIQMRLFMLHHPRIQY